MIPALCRQRTGECKASLSDIVRPYLKKKLGGGREESKRQVEYEEEGRRKRK